MPVYLIVAQVLVSLALIGAILFQVKGGGLGGIFGQPGSVYRTRRGIEKSLYQLTIALGIIFVVLSVVIARIMV